MKLRPIHDRLIVKRLEAESRTKSGLYIPEQAKEKPQQGEVLAAGQGFMKEDGSLRPMSVKTGEKILFGKFAGTEIEIDGERFLIIREDDVLSIVDGEK